MPMKVLVCGDRNYSNVQAIRDELSKFLRDTVIIEGGARGADTLARTVSEELGLTVIEIKADWGQFGLAAGPIRNKKMLDLKPDLVLAFHDNIENSRGTKNMIAQARTAGVEVRLIAFFKVVENKS